MIIMNTDAPHGGRSVDLKSYTYNKEDNGLTIFRYTTWESYFLMLLRRKRVQSRILTTVCLHHFYQGQIMLHKTQTTLNNKYQLKKNLQSAYLFCEFKENHSESTLMSFSENVSLPVECCLSTNGTVVCTHLDSVEVTKHIPKPR